MVTEKQGLKEFELALREICIYLAKLMAEDGEGANQLVEVAVTGAKNISEARKVARVIAGSPLVKTAIYGGDPNFGRILGAAGAADSSLVPEKLTLKIGNITLFQKGESLAHNQKKAEKFFKQKTVVISLDLGQGPGQGTAWGCDLSCDYVKINAKYHT